MGGQLLLTKKSCLRFLIQRLLLEADVLFYFKLVVCQVSVMDDVHTVTY